MTFETETRKSLLDNMSCEIQRQNRDLPLECRLGALRKSYGKTIWSTPISYQRFVVYSNAHCRVDTFMCSDWSNCLRD